MRQQEQQSCIRYLHILRVIHEEPAARRIQRCWVGEPAATAMKHIKTTHMRIVLDANAASTASACAGPPADGGHQFASHPLAQPRVTWRAPAHGPVLDAEVQHRAVDTAREDAAHVQEAGQAKGGRPGRALFPLHAQQRFLLLQTQVRPGLVLKMRSDWR